MARPIVRPGPPPRARLLISRRTILRTMRTRASVGFKSAGGVICAAGGCWRAKDGAVAGVVEGGRAKAALTSPQRRERPPPPCAHAHTDSDEPYTCR